MSAIRKSNPRKAAKRKPRYDARATATQREVALRELCSRLRFWKACGNKPCLRAKSCAGNGEACFARLWPLVPEATKVPIRAVIKASAAGLAPREIAAEVDRQRRLWRETQAKAAASAMPPQPAPRVAAPRPRIRAL
jgi:hypothetical protein